MTSADLSGAIWHKSSYSGDSGDCVEVAAVRGRVAIRDSKDPEGGALLLEARAWSGLLSAVRSGDLDLR